MTDEEIICGWMEEKPSRPAEGLRRPQFSERKWWFAGSRPHREWDEWYPCELTLDRLHEVGCCTVLVGRVAEIGLAGVRPRLCRAEDQGVGDCIQGRCGVVDTTTGGRP